MVEQYLQQLTPGGLFVAALLFALFLIVAAVAFIVTPMQDRRCPDCRSFYTKVYKTSNGRGYFCRNCGAGWKTVDKMREDRGNE